MTKTKEAFFGHRVCYFFILLQLIINLFTWSKQKRLFWRAGFYPVNQNFLNTF